MRELELIALAKSGDQHAKEVLIAKYERYIYKFINTYFNPKTMCADLQEDLYSCGIMAILDSIDTFDETKATFSTHVYIRIRKAVQNGITLYRKSFKSDTLSMDYEYNDSSDEKATLHDFVVDDSVNVESTVVDNQMKKEVWQVAKEVCSDREYKVITLMSKSNMSYEECAKCLNTTVLSVNGCRNKAITKIRRYFA